MFEDLDNFQPSSELVVRAPIQPFHRFREWAPDGSEERARALLVAALQERTVQESLNLASPGFVQRLDHWLRHPNSREGQRLEQALVRYFSRMCTRSTPFGLFAGVGVGRLAERTRMVLGPREEHRKFVRIDNQSLFRLVENAKEDPALRERLVWRPNPTVYEVGGTLRWPQAQLVSGKRFFRLVEIEATEAVTETLERAEKGARLTDLATALAEDDDEIELEDALGFVDELAALQLLQCEVDFRVTGDEPARGVLSRLQGLGAPVYEKRLEAVLTATEVLAADTFGTPAYDEAMDLLSSMAPDPDASRDVQVDLFLSIPELTVSHAVERQVLRACDIARRVAKPNDRKRLESFRDKLVERWGDRGIPLVQALDEDVGVGYGSTGAETADAPLLAGLPIQSLGQPQGTWSPRDHHLLRRLHRCLTTGTRVLELDDELLDQIDTRGDLLPDAFSAMVTLAAQDDEAIDRGDYEIVFQGAYGPSGARLHGRFCHASAAVRRMAEEHLRAEEALRPDVLFAEIIHLNEGREGNLVCRPVLRRHEIPLSGSHGAAAEDTIPVSDLAIAVRGNELVLYSVSRGKRIVPRLTSALTVD